MENDYIEFGVMLFFQVIALGVLFWIAILLFSYFYRRPLYTHLYFYLKKLPDREQFVLRNEVDYYKKLPDKKKKYFEHRVAVFLEKHPIVSREGLGVTPQMRVLIASASVSLTFGLQRYTYTSFRTILVYPDIYFSTITEQYHKGEFNPRDKVLVFSWKHFLQGNEVVGDNINLGIHEFAHALHFEMKKDHPNSYHFKKYFMMLLLEIRKQEKREKLRASTYFRDYAFENKYEFLAVLVENYFESPEVFQQEFPFFFEKIKKMLNQ